MEVEGLVSVCLPARLDRAVVMAVFVHVQRLAVLRGIELDTHFNQILGITKGVLDPAFRFHVVLDEGLVTRPANFIWVAFPSGSFVGASVGAAAKARHGTYVYVLFNRCLRADIHDG